MATEPVRAAIGPGEPWRTAPDDPPEANAQPVSGSDLARGLMLLRASNMNVVRLQLAMERRDRRLAMEAVDDLVALDREIGGFVSAMPQARSHFGDLSREIEGQRTAIAAEKLVLAGGKSGPRLRTGAEQDASTEAADPPDWIGPIIADGEEDAAPGGAVRGAAVVGGMLLFIGAGTAAAIYALGLDLAPLVDAARTWLGELR